jgi:hypothetical protein
VIASVPQDFQAYHFNDELLGQIRAAELQMLARKRKKPSRRQYLAFARLSTTYEQLPIGCVYVDQVLCDVAALRGAPGMTRSDLDALTAAHN